MAVVSDVIGTEWDGERVVAVVPTISEDLPEPIREGLARRRLVTLGRACPCGARAPRLNREQRREIAARKRKGLPARVYRFVVEHEADCPACDQVLDELAARHDLMLRRWDW